METNRNTNVGRNNVGRNKAEEEETKLQQLQVDNEAKIAEARVKAYNNFDGLESCEEVFEHKSWRDSQNTEYFS